MKLSMMDIKSAHNALKKARQEAAATVRDTSKHETSVRASVVARNRFESMCQEFGISPARYDAKWS